MSKQLTLNLYLPDGSPDNCVIVSSFNWTGECMKCSRLGISSLYSRYKNSISGIYVLFGYDKGKNISLVYIGESEDVIKRIKQHLKDNDKSWFEEIIVFSCSKVLSKGHIKNLEYKLIKLAKKSINYFCENGNTGTESSLPEYVYPEVNTFLEYILMIMPILGYQGLLVSEKLEKLSKSLENNIKTVKYLNATGILIEGKKFRIYKGSQMSKKEVDSCRDGIKNARLRLIETGVVNSETFVFEQSHDFNSTSGAAGVVCGGNVNGWDVWKNDAGNTLGEIESRNINKKVSINNKRLDTILNLG
ncbi:MAG: GIY-YIG nuclease family protein [Proteobacteria bacterium]|nr:GIY-YIG nuclease family protein [Pseudomonadota bacterium]